ncbi:hypothetical protein [Bradyrhizobium sp. URHA0013]|jgi:hypothetical protein|uniref:hypothetical protein n=1 Tax=Bradyrhizobium sp. URHA0013 TaxID=1380352 RepID=UPI0004AE2096|nr:hypothetical protein [Bradyrhizobium sp. URHA0013]
MSVDRGGFDLCVVHDRTDRGLCIELAFGADCLPDAFELSFDSFGQAMPARSFGATTEALE